MIKSSTNVQTTMTHKVKDKQVKYHWCPSHCDGKGLWVHHTKEECSLFKKQQENDIPRLQANFSTIDSNKNSNL